MSNILMRYRVLGSFLNLAPSQLILVVRSECSFIGFMEREDSILDALYEEDNLEDLQDVEMLDVEEGELLEEKGQIQSGQSSSSGNADVVVQDTCSRNRKRRSNKKKNKKKKSSSVPNVTDINRFVIDTCKRLKERKSYLIWSAVGCLGVSAMSDLVKEVDAIQACGGQLTADGKRFRTGGGVLWNILKTREPDAYKEIMKRGKEFEKGFRQQNFRQPPQPKKQDPAATDQIDVSVSDSSEALTQAQSQPEEPHTEKKPVSILDRIRVPITYDDFVAEEPKDEEK
ncbi:Phosphorylated adapter RNA export protein, RNA-binding domain [Dillenia turbinata]|uniref:Phosphorylated adapter RNA export protein n=1 Tax=Dillenia turbinata TaxID=194707 RepID=A0AAN8YTU7_9MAGN